MTVPVEGSRRSTVIGAGVIVLVVCLAAIFLLRRSRARNIAAEQQQRTTSAEEGPIVRTMLAAAATGNRDVVLQGEADPWASVTLYAKVSGYLKRITVDKGDAVRTGEVLADIESPETDQAYLAAQADAAAKHELAERDHQLLTKKFVAPEEVETADAASKIADARSAGLNTEQGYEQLRAPFDGTVTARFADPGALVQDAATSQTSALPVVTIADVDTLRVRVYLDQRTASLARRGLPVEIRLPERPGFVLHAALSRLTEELDPRTRTLLAEIDVDNRKHELLAGSFVDVHLTLPAPAAVSVPAEAVLTRGDRQLVGVVDSADRIHLRSVTLGENDGTNVDILQGLKVGDRIALNLGENIPDGTVVRPDPVTGGVP